MNLIYCKGYGLCFIFVVAFPVRHEVALLDKL